MKKVLITGGAGKMGKFVAEELRKKYEVKLFDLKPTDPIEEFLKGDIRVLQDVEKAMKGSDTVIHLAAIPGDTGEAQKIMETNVMGTFNVLEAAANHGVKKIIYASSISAYGFVWWKKPFMPEYFPVDEDHPCIPHDSYGLSKLFGEKLCYGYTQRYNIATTCLRIAPVLFPNSEKSKLWINNIKNPTFTYTEFGQLLSFKDLLWSYVDVRDVVQVIKLSLGKVEVKHVIYNIGANDTLSEIDSIELIRSYYTQVKFIHNEEQFIKNKKSPLFSISKVSNELGYSPKHSWRNYLLE